MDELNGKIMEAIDSARRVGITPPCFEPNDSIVRLIRFVHVWLLAEQYERAKGGRF